MHKIIKSTINLINILDSSDLIKDLVLYKNKLLNNKEILTLIENINKNNNESEIIKLKKELYLNKDYKKYIDRYNELNYIILKINMQYKNILNTRSCL